MHKQMEGRREVFANICVTFWERPGISRLMRFSRRSFQTVPQMNIPSPLPAPSRETKITLSIPTERLQILHVAAQTLGRPVEELLRESVELCVDTSVALAVHKSGLQ